MRFNEEDFAVQAEIDAANSDFWNTLCGTGMATGLGIKDHSPESLKRFDDAYFNMYPYLLPIIRSERMVGKKVLEVGLGYGTLGQKLAEAAEDYTGLDIAANPVAMMNTRLQMHGLPGRALQGNSLQMPFSDRSFDHVVSIGCFHHTGNVQQCINETYRVLKPNGTAVLMVYNKFSYRRWSGWPGKTLAALFGEAFSRKSKRERDERANAAYDTDMAGKGAPETDFLSIRDLKEILKQFGSVQFKKQNCDGMFIYRGQFLLQREKLLPVLGPLMGLDIYMEAQKSAA